MFASEWHSTATLVNREVVAVGTQRLTFAVPQGTALPHQPGHVVTLSIQVGDALARRVYTVSECDDSLGHLTFTMRIVTQGRISPLLSSIPLGTAVDLSGCRRQSIESSIAPQAARVICIGTGSAAGPLLGFAKAYLSRPDARPLSVVLGFRHAEAICFSKEFEALSAVHQQFCYLFTLSAPPAQWPGLTGRVGTVAPANVSDFRRAHFHLIGNGTMVTEWRMALRGLDLAPTQVSTESYFRTALPDENAIAALSATLRLRLA